MQIIAPDLAVPMHFDDYDRFTSPLSDFLEAASEAGLGDRVHVLERRATMDLRSLAVRSS